MLSLWADSPQPYPLLRVASSFSPPPLSFLLSGGSGWSARGWTWWLAPPLFIVAVVFGVCAYVPFGSRSPENLGRLRRGLDLVSLAVVLRWQELSQAGVLGLGISANKVGRWSSASRSVAHAGEQPSQLFFVTLPWRKMTEEAGASSTKRCVLLWYAELVAWLLPLAGRGGEEVEQFHLEFFHAARRGICDLRLHLPKLFCRSEAASLRSSYTEDMFAEVIQGHRRPLRAVACILHHGSSSTSVLEAFVGALRRSSTSSCLQVVRPRRRRGGRRCLFLAGLEAVASTHTLFNFGVHRLEVAGELGGGDTEAPDCFFSFSARVFFVKLEALSLISRFLRASVVKGRCSEVVSISSLSFTMLNLKAVEGCSVTPPAPCWPAGRRHGLLPPAPSFHYYHQRSYLRLTAVVAVGNASRLLLPSTEPPRLEIFSRDRHHSHPLYRICAGTRTVSPCSAYGEGGLVAENNTRRPANVDRKEREARIMKQLQLVTISPSAYDTAWVSMVPMPGSPHVPCFPQCIEWVLQNQKDDGSWGIKQIGSSVNKATLLSTLACVIALQKWNLGEEQMSRGLQFIGNNLSIVMDKQIAAPVGFSLIFPGMLSSAIEMGLEFPAFRQNDIDEVLRIWEHELKRLSMEKSYGTKAYLAYVSEGLGNLADWSEVMKFQRKNGSLFNSPSTTAALLVHKYDNKALQFLSSVASNFGGAVPTVYPLNIRCQLSMVDSLEKIGISQHFSSEIKSILDMTYSLWLQRDEEVMLDFATCSIAFRLLRMNGYCVSPDELSHVEELSCFHNSFQGYLNDTKSLLELYKASKVSISENEFVLDNMGYWSRNLLMELPSDGVQKLPILSEVDSINK